MVFIIRYPAVRFMMADKRHAFGSGIVGDLFQVKVRIRFGKVEMISIPTFVPAFNKYSLKTVSGGKVYMPQCIGSGSAVAWACVPGVFMHVVSPPDSNVSSGLYPGCILNAARLVQIQHKA